MILEKIISIAVIMFGIFLYVTGLAFGINDLWWNIATGGEVITGVLLLDGVTRGWIL